MSSPTAEYAVTIYRLTGEPLRFKLRRTAEQIRNVGSIIENGLAARFLGVIQECKLIIVPAHQIAGIEIDPAPKVLVRHVIKDIEPVS